MAKYVVVYCDICLTKNELVIATKYHADINTSRADLCDKCAEKHSFLEYKDWAPEKLVTPLRDWL